MQLMSSAAMVPCALVHDLCIQGSVIQNIDNNLEQQSVLCTVCLADGWQLLEAAAWQLPAVTARRAPWSACPALGAALPSTQPRPVDTIPAQNTRTVKTVTIISMPHYCLPS